MAGGLSPLAPDKSLEDPSISDDNELRVGVPVRCIVLLEKRFQLGHVFLVVLVDERVGHVADVVWRLDRSSNHDGDGPAVWQDPKEYWKTPRPMKSGRENDSKRLPRFWTRRTIDPGSFGI